MAEDRELFKKAMEDIGLLTPRAQVAKDFDKALVIQKDIGYPIIIRPSFTLGGSGGGIAYNKQDFEKIVKRGLDLSPTNEVLLEESVIGWKEFKWKSLGIKMITVSLFVLLKTSMQWAFIQETLSQ